MLQSNHSTHHNKTENKVGNKQIKRTAIMTFKCPITNIMWDRSYSLMVIVPMTDTRSEITFKDPRVYFEYSTEALSFRRNIKLMTPDDLLSPDDKYICIELRHTFMTDMTEGDNIHHVVYQIPRELQSASNELILEKVSPYLKYEFHRERGPLGFYEKLEILSLSVMFGKEIENPERFNPEWNEMYGGI